MTKGQAKPTKFEWLMTQLNPFEAHELKRLADSEYARSRGYELNKPYDRESVADMLTLGFMWSTTPQGFHYWNSVHEKYQQKELRYG